MLPIPMSADPGVARNADQPRHPSVDAPDHPLTPGAERHPNADLARPPRDRERDDRMETDARQHQSEAAPQSRVFLQRRFFRILPDGPDTTLMPLRVRPQRP
jgi:hypothetical protein